MNMFKNEFDKLKGKPFNFRDCNLYKKKKDFQIIKVHQFFMQKKGKKIYIKLVQIILMNIQFLFNYIKKLKNKKNLKIKVIK